MPYTYKKTGNKYTVYKKSGEKVGTTGGTKEQLKKYLAALHIHEPKKGMKKEAVEGALDTVYAVQKPYVGCELTSLVHPIDPLVGLEGSTIVPDSVHNVYVDQQMALDAAKDLYEAYCKDQEMLEEKKATTSEKIKKAIDTLEKKHKEHIAMVKEDPKNAAKHKEHIAKIAGQIDDLMTKLEKIEKSKKSVEKEKEDKKKGALDEMKNILKQSKLSSKEYQDAKKLKDFKASDWKWNKEEQLYTKK